MMPSDTHKIVIRADKTPVGEHVRRFNAPTVDEVVIIIIRDKFKPRDIVLHRRNEQLTKVSEIHRCYDALQYPITFWDGADGYNFNVKVVNRVNGEETNMKCSAMNYYSYRLMRLIFIRLNQTKLRSEEYVHLQDAAVHDGNTTNVGRLTILPSSCIGSPRHMHKYAQDTIAYVRLYGV
ncbi:helitron_like_N domain-containing protein [Trichonephila clavipes]|nr:helitron_like_N domain-containing protein [Trichonephila clavipes]